MGGGGGELSGNHNMSNPKILYCLTDRYVMASKLRSINLNMSSHPDDVTVLFVQAVNDSQALTYIVENFLNVMNTNPSTSTLVDIPLKQMPYIK